MSKSSELKILRYGRSVDAPVNYHHRTGDVEGEGGSRLDLYVQVESAEEVVFQGEDELAKAQFLKGFQGYLRKVFSKHEREFLRRLMGGREKPHEVGRALGVDWFKYMHGIQRKAYKNIKPLVKLSELTGWTRAEEFTALLLRRLSILEDGMDVVDVLPDSGNRAKIRAALKAEREQAKAEKRRRGSVWQALNREKYKAYCKAYYIARREEVLEKQKAYVEQNREKVKAYKKAYHEKNKEKHNAQQKAYYEAHKEEVKAYAQAHRAEKKAYMRAYRQARREETKAYKRKYYAQKKAEREAAKLAALEAGNA